MRSYLHNIVCVILDLSNHEYTAVLLKISFIMSSNKLASKLLIKRNKLSEKKRKCENVTIENVMSENVLNENEESHDPPSVEVLSLIHISEPTRPY